MVDERQLEVARDIICMIKDLEPDYISALACTLADVDCDVRGISRETWAVAYVVNGRTIDGLEED